MTYDNLALALVNESSYLLNDEVSSFIKICESINILNENGILLEEDKTILEKLKDKAIKAWEKLLKVLNDIREKIMSLYRKIRDYIRQKKASNKELILTKNIKINAVGNVISYADDLSYISDIEIMDSKFYGSLTWAIPESKEYDLQEGADVSNELLDLSEKINSCENRIKELNKAIEKEKNSLSSTEDINEMEKYKRRIAIEQYILNIYKEASIICNRNFRTIMSSCK